MITVHVLENSRAQRVLWLLEELGLPYQVKSYKRDPKTLLAPPELLAVHPLGKSPVITDGNATVAESAAILEYILARYAPDNRLVPQRGSEPWVQYSYWMHYAEGTMMPLLVNLLVFTKMGESAPAMIRPIAKKIGEAMTDLLVKPQLPRHFAMWETALARTGWFDGEQFSAADIMMSYPVEAAVDRAGAGQGRPNIQRYLSAIRSRPAYQRALNQVGGALAPA